MQLGSALFRLQQLRFECYFQPCCIQACACQTSCLWKYICAGTVVGGALLTASYIRLRRRRGRPVDAVVPGACLSSFQTGNFRASVLRLGDYFVSQRCSRLVLVSKLQAGHPGLCSLTLSVKSCWPSRLLSVCMSECRSPTPETLGSSCAPDGTHAFVPAPGAHSKAEGTATGGCAVPCCRRVQACPRLAFLARVAAFKQC